MFIKRKYLIRHKILDTLQKKLSQYDGHEHVADIKMSLKELSAESNLNEQKITQQIDVLDISKEIHIHWEHGIQYFTILRNGSISYFDKKYLYEGRKSFWNDTYDIVKTISTVILLIFAIITFILNLVDTRKNKQDIEKMKTDIQHLKSSVDNIKMTKRR